jgi:magnesium transporter
MRRELVSGFALGLLLGSVGFLRIFFGARVLGQYGEHWMLIGITVCVTLMGVVLLGTLAGSMLPLLLKRVGLDPAVSSAPFVATLVDVAGIALYFEVAMLLLKGTLL